MRRFKKQLPADSAATFALIECRVKKTNGLTLTSADYDRRRPAFVTVQDAKAFHCKPSPAEIADAADIDAAENREADAVAAENAAGNISVKNASAKILRQYADAAADADANAERDADADANAERDAERDYCFKNAAADVAASFAADAAVKRDAAAVVAAHYADDAAKCTYYGDKAKDAADVADAAIVAAAAAIDAAEVARIIADDMPADDTPADDTQTPNFSAIRQILIDAGKYCDSLYIDDTISEIAEKFADYFGRNFAAFDRAEFLGDTPPRFPDVWQIVNVPDTQWQADNSGLNCLINWILPADIVRLDLIAADGVPVISFQGQTDNVRKHSMAWLSLNCPAFDLSHAAYIGSELEKADAERIDYVQDGDDADDAADAAQLQDVAASHRTAAEDAMLDAFEKDERPIK
jgi:hypothetical protein